MPELINTIETTNNIVTDNLLLKQIHSAEKNRRSIAKSATYRVLSITADSIAAYFFTRDVALSAGIVILVNGYSVFLYYFHERIWAHVHWGRENKI